MRPIFQSIGLLDRNNSKELLVIHWIPTGSMSLFPLHAAGNTSLGPQSMRCIMQCLHTQSAPRLLFRRSNTSRTFVKANNKNNTRKGKVELYLYQCLQLRAPRTWIRKWRRRLLRRTCQIAPISFDLQAKKSWTHRLALKSSILHVTYTYILWIQVQATWSL